MRSSEWASTFIGACIVVPQLIVAGFAPSIGRLADSWGRRPLLFLCFVALAARGVLFAFVTNPYLVITGSAVVITHVGVRVYLITDITCRTRT